MTILPAAVAAAVDVDAAPDGLARADGGVGDGENHLADLLSRAGAAERFGLERAPVVGVAAAGGAAAHGDDGLHSRARLPGDGAEVEAQLAHRLAAVGAVIDAGDLIVLHGRFLEVDAHLVGGGGE